MPPVKVEIQGNEYVLNSSAGEGHVRRVASHLNAQLLEAQGASAATSSQAAVILAALNITNDLLQIRDQQKQMLREIEAKTERMLEKIERCLK